MNRYQFKSAEERDAVQCQLFVESLGGIALDWFSRLEANSINNYKELTTAFVKHFSMFIGQNTKNSELWKIVQGASESPRDFIQRFKTIVATCTISDEAALLSEEEEEGAYEQNYQAKQPERPKATNNEPQSGYNRGYENRKKFYANAIQQSARQWINNWVCSEEDQDESLFCEFHNRKGHSTEDCKHLREYLLAQYRKGQISLDDLRRSNVLRSKSPRPNNVPPENTVAKDPPAPPALPALPPPPPNPPGLP
ncbi:uncharacterized protein LOC112089914 [Eutrema salsugineum]|uniref:uncharacterized protein LOC112089914 n=1 Tax=Eutrema salsugineum TaxID=72664 RepID=UPI000CED57D2|nr:uncharacterized protein LOC112089914 [Eutrema salsugineum]